MGTLQTRQENASHDIIMPLIAPIMVWLEIEEIEEIAINRPEEIWLRLRKPDEQGRLWVPRVDPVLTRARIELIICCLANLNNTAHFGPDGNPSVFGTLPGGHRFAAAFGPNIQYVAGDQPAEGTVIFCARQFKPDMPIRFSNYGLQMGIPLRPQNAALRRKSDTEEALTRLMTSIERGDHILVSGPMGCGKTTLLNHIIRLLKDDLRIITVEDTSEIKVDQPNHVHLMLNRVEGSNNFDYKSVVDLIKRMTPDVIMAGEISTKNAAAVWELMRTGHGHFMTTIHAETVEEAVESFITNISHSSPSEAADRNRLRQDMFNKLRIVQVAREGSERRITEIA